MTLSIVLPYEKTHAQITEIPSDVSSEDDTPPQKSAGWKPHTLRPPLLTAVVICLLGLVVVLEYLSRLGERNGALITSCQGFTTGTTFMYLYLPTIFAVFLSLLWSWIDLDAKRLEPYFQMSKSEGADPKDSLDLHYPFDFVALAPLKAIRNRHWGVAACGSAMLMIFWLLTPLIGAIFTARDITIRQRQPVKYGFKVPAVEGQIEQLTNRFFTMAYKHIWAGEALPAFTTANATLEPFEVKSDLADMPSARTTWSAMTTMYSTSLTCKNATLTADGRIYDNANGCTIDRIYFGNGTSPSLLMLYFGYWTSELNDHYLSGFLGCGSRKNQHLFFGFVAGPEPQQTRITPFFCEASYWQQEVNATVLASNQTIVATQAAGPPAPLLDNVFNATNFEYIMNAELPYLSKRADIVDTSVRISHGWRLLEKFSLNTSDVISPLLALGIANSQLPFKAFFNQDDLITTIQTAHELLFALAFQSLFVKSGDALRSSTAVETYTCPSVIIVRKLAIAVEVVLGLVAFITTFMIWLYWRRQSGMLCDVKSISDISRLLSGEQCCPDSSQHSGEDICASVRLKHGQLQLQLPSLERRAKSQRKGPDMNDKQSGSWEISRITGAILIFCLIAAVAIILTMHALIEMKSGLPQPSTKDVVNQLLTNYLPVAFASFLEPFWTLLNRILCVMRPFQALARGDAPVQKSLGLRYTSLPPQFAFWRALQVGDMMLVLVCIIGLSANVLAVTFSGLFTASSTPLKATASFKQLYRPLYERAGRFRFFEADSGVLLATASSFTNETIQPPWIWNDTFFIPFDLSSGDDQDLGSSFSGHTFGFASEIACTEVNYDTGAFLGYHGGVDVPLVDLGDGKKCSHPQNGPAGGQNHSRMAAEVSVGLFNDGNGTDCETKFLAGFLRGNLTVSDNLMKTDHDAMGKWQLSFNVNNLDATWMVCNQKLHVSQYLVTIDQSARVQKAEPSSLLLIDTAQFFPSNLNESFFMGSASSEFTEGPNVQSWWRNDTFTDNWFGYLIKLVDAKFTDPAQPTPSFEEVQDAVKSVWKRMFAVRLGMNPSWLGTASAGNTITGQAIKKETRITMSKPAFVISVALLAANIGAAILYYFVQRPTIAVLPKMPITIGRVMALLEGSSLMEGGEKIQEDTKVGYGEFIGTDSRLHVGIERSARLQSAVAGDDVSWG